MRRIVALMLVLLLAGSSVPPSGPINPAIRLDPSRIVDSRPDARLPWIVTHPYTITDRVLERLGRRVPYQSESFSVNRQLVPQPL